MIEKIKLMCLSFREILYYPSLSLRQRRRRISNSLTQIQLFVRLCGEMYVNNGKNIRYALNVFYKPVNPVTTDCMSRFLIVIVSTWGIETSHNIWSESSTPSNFLRLFSDRFSPKKSVQQLYHSTRKKRTVQTVYLNSDRIITVYLISHLIVQHTAVG